MSKMSIADRIAAKQKAAAASEAPVYRDSTVEPLLERTVDGFYAGPVYPATGDKVATFNKTGKNKFFSFWFETTENGGGSSLQLSCNVTYGAGQDQLASLYRFMDDPDPIIAADASPSDATAQGVLEALTGQMYVVQKLGKPKNGKRWPNVFTYTTEEAQALFEAKGWEWPTWPGPEAFGVTEDPVGASDEDLYGEDGDEDY